MVRMREIGRKYCKTDKMDSNWHRGVVDTPHKWKRVSSSETSGFARYEAIGPSIVVLGGIMSDQATTTRPRVRSGSERGPTVLRQAASILEARHQVSEMAAYEMLVTRAVQAGSSVREAARAIVEEPAAP